MKETKDLNTKNKISKANNGITLIALVITIIVMLILVAVTISMAVNGGLFDYAGKAVGETNNVMLAEGQLGNGGVTVDGTYYNSIDDYLNKDEVITEKITFTLNGKSFEALPGQTWEFWIENGGDELGFGKATSGKLLYLLDDSDGYVYYDGDYVYFDSNIIDGGEYTTGK